MTCLCHSFDPACTLRPDVWTNSLNTYQLWLFLWPRRRAVTAPLILKLKTLPHVSPPPPINRGRGTATAKLQKACLTKLSCKNINFSINIFRSHDNFKVHLRRLLISLCHSAVVHACTSCKRVSFMLLCTPPAGGGLNSSSRSSAFSTPAILLEPQV